MAEALVAALMTERALLRKEIRRAQGENQSLTLRADGLEVQIRTLEEAVDDRAGARWEVQEASAAQLEARLADQRDWNTRAEAKRNTLANTLDRKRQSLAWMRESGAYLHTELAALMDGLQQTVAMHRSEELSDATTIGQLDTRLAHRQFALMSLTNEQTRHAEGLRALWQFTVDQRQHVQACAASKLSALERERVRVAHNLQAAKEMTEQKRSPQPEKQLRFGVPRAQLAACLYTSHTSSIRSGVRADDDCFTKVDTRVDGGTSYCDDIWGAVRGPSAAADRTQQLLQYDDAVEVEGPCGKGPTHADVYQGLDPLVAPISSCVPALRTNNKSRDDAASVVLRSEVSTPRFSRGPTPRTGTPRMATATRASPVTGKPKTVIKPKPHKVPLPSMIATEGVTPQSRVQQQPSPSPEPPAPSQSAASTTPLQRPDAKRAHDIAVRSAVSLKNALQVPPPLLSRMALHRGIHTNIAAKQHSSAAQ